MSQLVPGLPDRKDIRARIRRASLLHFIEDSYAGYEAGYVHKDICRRLQKFSDDVIAGKEPRVMLFMPPRHGKSFIVSERFPVWHMGRAPHHQVAACAYNQTQANRYSRKARAVAKLPIVAETWPDLHWSDQREAVEEWETTAGGAYRAVGVGGGITGTGADILILDDVIKDHEEASSEVIREKVWDWYASTAYTRLMPGGGILVIMTRWHDDDLAGRLIAAMEAEEGDDEEYAERWEIIRYPAIAEEDEVDQLTGEVWRRRGEPLHPERWPLRALKKRERRLGDKWFAMYQQRPMAAQGGRLNRQSWRFWYPDVPGKPPPPPVKVQLADGTYHTCPQVALPPTREEQAEAMELALQSYDTSFKDTKKADFAVGQVWGKRGPDAFLLDQWRERADVVAAIAGLLGLTHAWPTALGKYVEDKANGPAIIALLKDKIPGLIAQPAIGSKESRVEAVLPVIRSGNTYLPHPAIDGFQWVWAFIAEAAAFPKGKNDDMVDAMAYGLWHIYLGNPFPPDQESEAVDLTQLLGIPDSSSGFGMPGMPGDLNLFLLQNPHLRKPPGAP